MPLKVLQAPTFAKAISRLKKRKALNFMAMLNQSGKRGVQALSKATPVDTGETANSWRYSVTNSGGLYTLSWHNDVMADTVPLVILIQYGHGTGTGAYIQGYDFINPALDPIKRDLKTKLQSEVRL